MDILQLSAYGEQVALNALLSSLHGQEVPPLLLHLQVTSPL